MRLLLLIVPSVRWKRMPVDIPVNWHQLFTANLFPRRRQVDTLAVPAQGRLHHAIASGVTWARAWRNAIRKTA